ncbi:MAG: 1-acyl-sn-glycerol-3-phosphate acyltransferase [Pseudomonadota bacterium]
MTEPSAEDRFADIRPYRDEEVGPVLQRLLRDNEFISAICRLRFKGLAAWLGWPLRLLVRRALAKELAPVKDVRSLQLVIEQYMVRMIEDTTAGFSVSGLDALDPGTPYLFISNHRDITLDPAFTNYALHHNGFDTVRIAIGDNLLTKPYVSDLMRLNKSFIVRRSARGPREMLKSLRELSSYIRHSVQVDRCNLWIAQREGRAKDGLDRTEPAIIKMLAMSQDKKSENFAEFIHQLNIVPVSISYELDPCDARKALELEALARTGEYEKAEHEDVASIATGISGNKGRVHVAFGQPLQGSYETPEQVAAALDASIIQNYHLQATNVYAWRMLHQGENPSGLEAVPAASCDEQAFTQRISALPAAQQAHALAIYANAIVSKESLVDSDSPKHC